MAPLPSIPNNDESKWLSMSEGALLVPYSAEYLSLLARKGKLTSKKIGNTWYTTRPALEEYMKRQMIRTHVQNGNYHAAAHLGNKASVVPEDPNKNLLRDEIALRQVRSFKTDTDEYINNSGILVEAIKPGEPEKKFVEKKLVTNPIQAQVREPQDSPVEAIEHMFERVLEKRSVGASGVKKTFHATRVRYRAVFTSRVMVVAAIICALSLTVFPVPLVFSFFEKSFTTVKEAIMDSNTVMGFRPGTHANEILLLDKQGNVSIMGHIETEGQLRSYIADGTAPIVVDSTTKVENLNADSVDGVSAEGFTLAFVTKNGNVTTEDVYFDGDVEVGKTLKVKGATRLLSTLEVDGGLHVFGNAEFANVLRVVGPAYFESVLTAQSNIEAKGDINADGNLSVRKNINVRGSIEVGSSVVAKGGSFGHLGVNGDFSATGKITLGNEDDDLIVTSKNVTIDTSGNASFDGGLSAASLGVTNLTATNSTTTNATSTNLYAENANFGNVNFGVIVSNDINFTNATGTNATSTNLYAVNAVFDNITSTGPINVVDLTFTDATGTNATTTNFYSDTISGLIAYITSIVAEDVSVGALTATNSTTTNATSTNNYSGNFTADTATITNLNSTNSTSTNATSTNLYAITADFGNLAFTNATGTNATTTNFYSTTASSTNLYGTNFNLGVGYLGNATTTNLYSTTASSTNLYSTNAELGSVVLGNATSTNFYSETASSTNLYTTNFNLGSGYLGSATTSELYVTGLTDGRVPFVTAGGLLTDSSLFTFDSSIGKLTTSYASTTQISSTGNAYLATLGGNVGIGTASPSEKLEVSGNLLVTGNSTTTNATTTNLYFSNNLTGPGNFIVNSSGNVGIGTTTPSVPLHLQAADGTSQLRIEGTSAYTDLIKSGTNLLFKNSGPSGSVIWQDGSSNSIMTVYIGSRRLAVNGVPTATLTGIKYSTYDLFDLTDSVAGDIFKVTNAGLVGIGTANPTEKLEVSGNLLVTGNSTTTNATTTNFFSTNGTFTNLYADTLDLTDLIFVNATGTNATTTNFFSTTASSTNLYSSLLSVGGASGLNVIAGGNVGIGTTAPGEKLHVSGGAILLDNNQYLKWKDSGGTARNVITVGTNNNLALGTTGISDILLSTGTLGEAVRIKATTGNVGIGTTAPSSRLQIGDATVSTSNAIILGKYETASSVNFPIIQQKSVLDAGVSNDLALGSRSSTGGILFYTGNSLGTAPGDPLGSSSNAIRMAINSSGNVGIGTTAPAGLLHIESTGATNQYITGGTASATRINFGDSDDRDIGQITYNNVTDAMSFTTNTATAMTILNDGKVGIGTTAPGKLLDVVGNVSPAVIRAKGGTASGNADIYADRNATTNNSAIHLATAGTDDWVFGLTNATDSTTGSDFRIRATGLGSVFSILKSSGNVGIGTTAPSRLLEVSHAGNVPGLRITRNDAAGNTGLEFADTGGVKWSLFKSPSGFSIAETYGGTPYFLIQPTTGNVGIGTTSPVTKFSVGGAAGDTTGHGYFTGGLGVGVVNTTAGTIQTSGDVTVGGALTINGSAVSSATTGQFTFLALPTGTAINEGTIYVNPVSAGTNNVLLGMAVNGTEKLRVDAEGDVQITGLFNSTNTSGTNDLSGSLAVDQNTTLGDASSDTVSFNARVNTSIIPSADLTYDLGTSILRWGNVFAGTTTISQLIAGGTASSTFIINDDNATADTEDATLEFSRGSLSPNAVLKWNSTSDRFEFNNFPLYVTSKLDVAGTASSSIAGPLWLTGMPVGTNLQDASLYVNPASASTDYSLFSVGVAGVERFRVDAEGDIVARASFGVENALYDVTDDTLTINDKLQINGNEIKDSTGTTRIGLGTTNTVTGNLTTTGNFIAQGAGPHYFQNGNVGIGTTTPSAKFEVSSGTGGIMDRIRVIPTGGASNRTLDIDRSLATSGWSLQTRFTSTASAGGDLLLQPLGGNVGIGTTNPGALLEVSSATGGITRLTRSSAIATIGAALGQVNFYNGATRAALVEAQADGATDSGRLDFWTTPTTGSLTERMTILSGGNVGIGTTAPLLKLSVYGASGYPATSGTAQTGIARFEGGFNNVLDIGQAGASPYGMWLQATDRSNLSTTYPLILNPNGGNVGIGTTTPSAKLNIAGGGSGANGALRISSAAGTTYWEIGRDNATTGDFTFSDNGVENMRITTTGNVGIGTTTPTEKLSVSGSSSGSVVVSTNNDNTAGLNGLYTSESGVQTGMVQWRGSTNGTLPSTLRVGSAIAGGSTLLTYGAGSSGLIVNSSGNVGIGTTSPNAKLNVVGSPLALPATSGTTQTGNSLRLKSSDSGVVLDFGSNGAGGQWIQSVNGGDLSANYSLLLNPNGGNVGIGTTTPASNLDVYSTTNALTTSNVAQLLVEGNSNNVGVQFQNYQTGGRNWALVGSGGFAGGFASMFLLRDFTGANRTPFAVDSNGNTYIGALNSTGSNVTSANFTVLNSGNVGIGTTGPATNLEISKARTADDTLLSLSITGNGVTGDKVNLLFNGTGISGVKRPQAKITGITESSTGFTGALAFSTASATDVLSEYMRITSSGNVGIGTTAPGSLLTLGGTPTITVDTVDGNDSKTLNISSGGTASVTRGAYITMRGNEAASNPGRVNINAGNVAGDGAITLTTQAIDRLFIGYGGNVGVGTTDPKSKFAVESASTGTSIGDGTVARFSSLNGLNARSEIGFNYFLSTATNNPVVLGYQATSYSGYTSGPFYIATRDVTTDTAPIERFTILGNGNVGIGDTSPAELFTVGSNDAFQITSLGAIASSSSITTSGPITIGTDVSLSRGTANRLDLGSGDSLRIYGGGYLDLFTTAFTEVIKTSRSGDSVNRFTLADTGDLSWGSGSASRDTNLYRSAANTLKTDDAFIAAGGITSNSGLTVTSGGITVTGNSTITGTLTGLTGLTSGGTASLATVNVSSLTASRFVLTDASKNLVSSGASSVLAATLTDETGTDKVVFNDSPTFANTITGDTGARGWKLSTDTGGSGSRSWFVLDTDSTDGIGVGGDYLSFLKDGVNATIGNIDSGYLSFQTSAADRMRILAGGQVGIGETSPIAKFTINSATSTTSVGDAVIARLQGANASNARTELGLTYAGASGYYTPVALGYQATSYSGNTSGSFYVATRNATTDTAPTERLTILPIGNVGIGTTNPLKLLEVDGGGTYGSIQFDPSSTYGTYIRTTAGSNNGILYLAPSSATTMLYDGSSAESLGIFNATTENVRLHSNGNSYFNGGNVGIGTTTPFTYNGFSKLLAVEGTTASIILKETSTGSQWELGADSIGRFRILDDSNSRLTIDSTGKIGIGTVTPSGNLDIESASGNLNLGAATASLEIVSTSNVVDALAELKFGGKTNTIGASIGYRHKSGTTNTNGDLVFATRNAITDADLTERMRIDSGGNVGIGTTAPTSQLEVVGNIETSNDAKIFGGGSPSSQSFIQLYNTASGNNELNIASVSHINVLLDTNNNNTDRYFSIATNADTQPAATELFRVQENGNVGIGTTGPGNKFDVLDASNPQLRLTQTDGSIYSTLQTLATTGGLTIATTGGTDPDIRLTPGTSGEVEITTGGSTWQFNGSTLFAPTGSGIISGLNEIYVEDGSAADPSYTFTNYQTTGLFTATGALGLTTNGAEVMRLTTGGNVGIGTTTPSALLNIAGGGSGANGALRISSNTGGTYWEIGRDNATTGDFTISDNGVENMRITIGGNVGIGTTTPGAKLEVSSPLGGTEPKIRISGSNGAAGTELGALSFYENNYFNFENAKIASVRNSSGSADAANLTFSTSQSSTLSERMRITSAGNVGIGTTTPQAKFHVLGTGTTGIRLTDDSGADANWELRVGDGLGPASGNAFAIWGGADGSEAQRLTIDSAGNVGIGTTAPDTQLHINGASTLSQIHLTNTTTGTTASDGFLLYNSGNEAYLVQKENAGLHLYTNNTEKLTVLAGGNVGIGTTNPGQLLQIDKSQNAATTAYITNGTNGTSARSQLVVGNANSQGALMGIDSANTEFSSLLASSITLATAGGNVNNMDVNLAARGSSGDINFYTGGEVAAGTHRMVIKSSGNVGIGTTAPNTNLHVGIDVSGDQVLAILGQQVSGQVLGDSPLLEFNTGGSTGSGGAAQIGGIAESATGGSRKTGFRILTDDQAGSGLTEKLRVTATGNVGIGTTAPSGKLHLSADSAVDVLLDRASTDANPAGLLFRKARGTIASPTIITTGDNLAYLAGRGYSGVTNGYTGGARINLLSEGTISSTAVPGVIQFLTTPASSITPAEVMRINSAGNVGIGTTAPDSLLEVAGNVNLGVATPAQALLSVDTNNAPTTGAGAITTSLEFFNNTSVAVTGQTGNVYGVSLPSLNLTSASAVIPVASQLYIASAPTISGGGSITNSYAIYANSGTNYFGGNVGIGTTAPTYQLQLKGSGATSQSFFKIQDSASVNQFLVESSAGGDAYVGIYETAGTRNILLNTNGDSYFNGGNLGIGTVSPVKQLEVRGSGSGTGIRVSDTTSGYGVDITGQPTGGLINVRNSAGTSVINIDAQGTNSSFFNNGGNVGIGTSAPVGRLDVAQNSSAAPALLLRNGDDNAGVNSKVQMMFGYTGTDDYASYLISRHDGGATKNALDFYVGDGTQNGVFPTNAVQNLTLQQGNVGIGTTNPLVKLDAQNTGATNVWIGASQTGTGSAGFLFDASNGDYAGGDYGELFQNNDLSIDLMQVGANPLYLGTSNTRRLTILSGGNIGIGTTAPTSRLQIGDATVSTANVLTFGKTETASETNLPTISQVSDLNPGASNDLRIASNSSSGGIVFGTGNGGPTTMVLNSSGNLGINDSTPTYKLDVNGTGRFTGALTADTTLGVTGLTTLSGGLTIPVAVVNTLGTNMKVVYGDWGSSNHVSGATNNKWIQVAEFTINGNYNAMRMSVGMGGRRPGSSGEGAPFQLYVQARNSTTDLETPTVWIQSLTSNAPSVKDVVLVRRSGTGVTNNVMEVWVQFGANWSDSFPVEINYWGTGTMNSLATTPQAQQDTITAGGTQYAVNSYGFAQNRLGIGSTVFTPNVGLSVGTNGANTTNTLASFYNGDETVVKILGVANTNGTGSHLHLMEDNANLYGFDTWYDTGNNVYKIDSYVNSVKTEVLTMTTGGNVGIGTTAPGALLDIYNTGTADTSPALFRARYYDTDTGPAVTGDFNVTNKALSFVSSITGTETQMYVEDKDNSSSRLTFDFRGNAGSNYILAGTSAGNVGIGTTTPDAKFEVTGGGTGTGRALVVNDSSNVDKFTVLDNGNVGIYGVLSFTGASVYNALNMANNNVINVNNFSISDGGASEGITWADQNWYIDTSPLDRSNATGNLNLYGTANNIALWRPSLWVYNATNYTTATAQSDGGLDFTTTGTGDISFNPGGNVGIGTTAPSRQVHIYGAGQAVSTGLTDAGNKGATLYIQDSGGSPYNGGTILFGANQGNFAAIKSLIRNGGTNTVGDLDFQTRNAVSDTALTSRLYILSTGEVGIGDTSPTYKLDVNGTFRATGATTFDSTVTSTGTLTANGTLDANGVVTLGDNGDNITIDSNTWDITAAGVASGFTGITSSGTNSFTGAVTNLGVSATTGANLNVFGPGTGQTEGGQINIQPASDYIGVTTAWGIDAFQHRLRIFPTGGSNGTANYFDIDNNTQAMTLGRAAGTLGLNGTLSTTGAFTLGDNGDTGSIDTSDWNISTTGVMTGISGITTDGDITLSGSAANIALGSNWLSGDGGDEGVTVDSSGNTSLTGTLTVNNQETITRSASGQTELEYFRLDGGSATAPDLKFAVGSDGTHNGSPIDIIVSGSGGAQSLRQEINNWGGYYTWSLGSSAGDKVVAAIGSTGSGSAATSQYGQLRLFAVSDAQTGYTGAAGSSNGDGNVTLQASGYSYFTGGNVGIGDTTPDDLFSVGATSQFKVDSSGNVTSGTITSGLINSQTISSAASFTGTVNATTGFKVAGGAASGNYLRGNGTNFVSAGISAGDVPTLNQNTTGSAATLTTTRTIWGQNFNGSANVTGALSGASTITLSGAISGGTTYSGSGTITTSDATASALTLSGASAGINFSSATGVKTIATGGTTDLNLAPGGNVGIGTAAPEAKLHVYGTNSIGEFTLEDDGPSGEAQFIIGSNDTSIVNNQYLGYLSFGSRDSVGNVLTPNASIYAKAKGDFTAGSNTPTKLYFDTTEVGSASLSTKMVIEADGRVGIGVENPAQMLGIHGTNTQISIDESSTEFLRLGVGETSGQSIVGFDDSDALVFGVYSSTSDTSITPLMTLNSDGSLEARLKNLIENYVVEIGESVTAGDVVAMLENGKIAKGFTGAGSDITLGTGSEDVNTGVTARQVFTLSSTKFVMTWWTGSALRMTVGDISAGVVTWGTAQTPPEAGAFYVSAAPLTSTTFIFVYVGVSVASPKAVVGTVSGTTISFGTPVQIENVTSYTYTAVDALSSTSFIATMTTPGGIKGRVGTVSGTSVSFSAASVTLDNVASASHGVTALSSSLFVMGNIRSTGSNRGVAVAATVSGTTISAGSAYVFNTSSSGSSYLSISDLSSSTFVITYYNAADSNNGHVLVGDVSGSTTITFGDPVVFVNAPIASIEGLDSTHFVIAYYTTADTTGRVVMGSITSTSTISLGTPKVYKTSGGINTYSNALNRGVAALDALNFVVSFDKQAITGAAVTGGYVGIAQTSGSAGATVPVIINGVSNVHSGLTTGSVYYADLNGNISTTTSSYKVGIAKSATEIQLGSERNTGSQYFGDMIFANNFFITESPYPKYGLELKNQLGNEILTIDENADLKVIGNINSASLRIGEENFIVEKGTGNINIGTSTPFSLVNGFDSKVRLTSATSTTALSIFGGDIEETTRTAPYLTVSSGSVGTTTADILVVDHSGNVGIGTSTPAWKLNIATDGLPQLALTDMSAAVDKKHGLISFIGGIFSIGTQIDALTSTSTSATSTLFTISDTGRVGIGTTTPGMKLSVSGSVGFDGLSTGFGAGSLCLSSDGEVVYNAGSDSCLPSLRETKHDITPLEFNEASSTSNGAGTTGALEKISKIIPVSFIYNDGPQDRTRYGFIAEDTAAVDPYFATYDDKGNITGIDDRAIIALSVKALKELDQKVQDTRNEIQEVASSTEGVLDLGELELASQATSTASSTVVVTDSSLQIYDRFVEVVRSTLSKLGIAIENGIVSVKSFATDMLSAKFAIINDLTVDALTINDKLCVEDVCVDKDQLKSLLMERGGSITQIVDSSQQTVDSNSTSTPTTTEPVVTSTPTITASSGTPPEAVATTTESVIADTTTANSTPEITATSTTEVIDTTTTASSTEPVVTPVIETTPTTDTTTPVETAPTESTPTTDTSASSTPAQ